MNFDVQSLSHVQLFLTPWTAACQASLSITNFWSLLKLISTDLVMPSNHLMICHPVLLLHSIIPSIKVFSNESALDIMWPKYWSFSFSISPSNEYLRLISFRIDWFDLLVIQGTLKSLLQLQFECISSLVLSLFYCSALKFVHNYWKNHSFDCADFVGKVMSLLFNMLSSFVIAFFQRSNFMAAVIVCSDFGAQANKVCHCFHCFPIVCHEKMGPMSMIFIFWMLSFNQTLSLFSFIFIKRL